MNKGCLGPALKKTVQFGEAQVGDIAEDRVGHGWGRHTVR